MSPLAVSMKPSTDTDIVNITLRIVSSYGVLAPPNGSAVTCGRPKGDRQVDGVVRRHAVRS